MQSAADAAKATGAVLDAVAGGGFTRESGETAEAFTAQATAGLPWRRTCLTMDADGRSASRKGCVLRGIGSTPPCVLSNKIDVLVPTGHMNAHCTDSLSSNHW
jgi:hypothetical protein